MHLAAEVGATDCSEGEHSDWRYRFDFVNRQSRRKKGEEKAARALQLSPDLWFLINFPAKSQPRTLITSWRSYVRLVCTYKFDGNGRKLATLSSRCLWIGAFLWATYWRAYPLKERLKAGLKAKLFADWLLWPPTPRKNPTLMNSNGNERKRGWAKRRNACAIN